MNKKINKILITGSSGTIGTALFTCLLNNGYHAIGIDKNENIWEKKLNKLTIKGDLLKNKDVQKIPKDIDLIIHLAANARVYDLVVSPNLAFENIEMTYNVLEFIRKNKIKKIIFSSSREIYGNRKKQTYKENDNENIDSCESPYAASKMAGESLVASYNNSYNIDYIIFRFSNVYGKYDKSDRLFPSFISRAINNKDIFIYGREKMLDFTYIDDCVKGILSSIKKYTKIKNNTFNLSSGKSHKLVDVSKLIIKQIKSNSNIIIKNNREGEVLKYIADISKAKKLLNYNPKYDIKTGVRLTVDWYLKNLFY